MGYSHLLARSCIVGYSLLLARSWLLGYSLLLARSYTMGYSYYLARSLFLGYSLYLAWGERERLPYSSAEPGNPSFSSFTNSGNSAKGAYRCHPPIPSPHALAYWVTRLSWLAPPPWVTRLSWLAHKMWVTQLFWLVRLIWVTSFLTSLIRSARFSPTPSLTQFPLGATAQPLPQSVF